MALLASCWFIIDYVLIPDGFLKWYSLSFFVHPLLLILCQIFLWVKLLRRWTSIVFFYPLRIVWFVGSWIFRFLRTRVILLFSATRSTNHEAVEVVIRCESPEISNPIQSVIFYNFSPRVPSIIYKLKGLEDERYRSEVKENNKIEDANMDGYLGSNEFSSCVCSSGPNDFSSCVCSSESPVTEGEVENEREESDVNMDEDMDMNESLMCVTSSESHVMEGEVENEIEEEESDPFYSKYIDGMRWFDLLNYERTCGISAILNKQMGTPSSLESIEPMEFSSPYIPWSKMSRRELLRSLESDFEMVYVGQSCLCWEALHHQYRKVEALACSSSQKGVFYGNVAGEFQKFQVLLERFMENEMTDGKRFRNYIQGRFSLKSLLQVPRVSGHFVEEKEGMKGESMRLREVLKAIEKSIRTFSEFVSTDNKKSCRWKFRSYLWTHPPVEDPKDLKLLSRLTKGLQQKELLLKDLQRRKRCWLKRANTLEESQRREIFFSKIDMKLVSRVLKMSVVSTLQLKWCQEKLSNIEFKEGRVLRARSDCFFPPS